jgi:hypothetical protein
MQVWLLAAAHKGFSSLFNAQSAGSWRLIRSVGTGLDNRSAQRARIPVEKREE